MFLTIRNNEQLKQFKFKKKNKEMYQRKETCVNTNKSKTGVKVKKLNKRGELKLIYQVEFVSIKTTCLSSK